MIARRVVDERLDTPRRCVLRLRAKMLDVSPRPLIAVVILASGLVHATSTTSDIGLARTDARVHAAFPRATTALAATYLPSDDTGLIGRNRDWGAMHSPRFQLGAGSALRTAIAAERLGAARRAFRAVEVGVEPVRRDGYLPSTLPAAIGGPPSAADVASAAAFFLGDACLGLRAFETSAGREQVASSERRRLTAERLGRALGWLLRQRERLETVDAHAPNRLLFDARSYAACSTFALDRRTRDAARAAARNFVDAALALQTPDGRFVEGGGHDTSYQGVAIRIGEDVLLAGHDDPERRLAAALASAARWLAARVDTRGRIDSSGNTRTCWSDERVFGERKRLSIPDVFTGLAYAGVRTGDETVLDAARRVRTRALEHPRADPCFAG